MRARGLVERVLEPRRDGGGVPAGGAAAAFEGDARLVGRVVFEQGLELLHRLGRIDQRRQAQRELEGGVGAQHVARVLQGREAFGAGDRQRGLPGAVEQRLDRVGGGRQREHGRAAAVVVRPREALVDLVAEDGRGGLGLRQPVGRHFAMEAGGQQAAGGAVFEAVEHLPHDAEARGHEARGVARVDAFGQHLDLERAAGHAAQRGREPQLVVVAGARIQADHQLDLAQARTQRVDVGQQVVGAAFLAGLDEADDARVRHALGLERLQRGHAGVHGVAVVGAAAAVEQAVLVLGRPRAEVVAPAGELGLLVEVAVHEHGLGHVRAGGRHFEEQHRRAAFEAHDLQLQALDLLRLDPGRGVAQHGLQVAVGRPVLVEAGRLGGNGDVVGELLDDVAVPSGGDIREGARRVERAGGHFTVQGGVHRGILRGDEKTHFAPRGERA
ncbi:hypothetical protein D3C87_471400 [compost metagenome]